MLKSAWPNLEAQKSSWSSSIWSGGISASGGAVAVLARDLWRMDTSDGLVESGGDGKLDVGGTSIDGLKV
jgi:hypothetical protein